MAWVIENKYNKYGCCISHREGEIGEATCPKCGYPVPAIFWSDGEIEAELCDVCKSEEKGGQQ
ncbi:MAG: hypothetical protein QW561_04330 [Candidatus Aenigmatarchaeota archaeon]